GVDLLSAGVTLFSAAVLGASAGAFFLPEEPPVPPHLEALDLAQEKSRTLAREKDQQARELYEQRGRLNTLMEVARTLSMVRRPEELLERIVKSAREQMNVSVAVVMLRRDEELVVAKSAGLSAPTLRHLRTRVGEGLFGALAQEGRAFSFSRQDGMESLEPYGLTPEVRELFTTVDDRIGYDGSVRERFVNLLAVPLLTPAEKSPFGLLVVANRLTGDRFQLDDQGYLSILATGAAISLSNARLLAEVETSYRETIVALAQAIEAKDPYTNEHVLRVASYSERIARSLGLPDEQVEQIYKAAILHDVGKISTPDRILSKAGPLSDDEFETMKAHAPRGSEILAKIRSLPKEVLLMVRHHHERWDGKGYPDGIERDQIPLGAQIIAVADCYDAMTSDRVYRKAFQHEDALRRMENGYGTQFSPQVLLAFFGLLEYTPRRVKAPPGKAAAGVEGELTAKSSPGSEAETPRSLELETGKEPCT
ncbi:MAG: HD domain-containing phosphohydrolase, partial [Candidatus Eremiobacterota bacterium]